MSPEPFVSRAKTLPAKRSEKGYGDENEEDLENIPEMGSDPTPGLGPLIISEQGVLKQLSSLNPNKACGPDQIPPWFLKTFAADIAPILTNIFQDSIDSGTVPHRWKEADVGAVFKKGKEIWPSQL